MRAGDTIGSPFPPRHATLMDRFAQERDLDTEPSPQARVVVSGEPVEGSDPLFVGSLDAAREFVAGLSNAQRAEIAIWTEDQVYSPDSLGA